MCPHCGRDAPLVYRGILASCAACGAPRPPLSRPSVNLAGRPSKVGGAVASVAGGLVLLFGLSLALGIGLVLRLLSAAFALAVSLPVALVALGLGLGLLLAGHRLRRSGARAARATLDRALADLVAYAAHAGRDGGAPGSVSAAEAASALGVSVAEADAMLTALAKREPDRMVVDLDDRGGLRYRAAAGAAWTRVRVAEDDPAAGEKGPDGPDAHAARGPR